MLPSNASDLTNDTDNPFIDAYFGSIKKARDTIAGQWKECIWDKKSLNVYDPASIAQVTLPCVLTPLLLLYFRKKTHY